MKKSDVAYTISCAFVTCYALSYCATMWFHLKLPRYYPLEHTWKVIKEEGVPSQGWYGMTAFAFVSAVVVTSFLRVGIRFLNSRKPELSPLVLKLIAAASILVLVGCMVYVALHEFLKWGVL